MSTIYTLNSKVLKNTANDKWLIKKEGLPPIPSNTVRVRTNDGEPPIKTQGAAYQTATLVTGTTNVYDVYNSYAYFYELLKGCTNVIEVLGSNNSSVTNMGSMFNGCTSLTSVSLFDTSNVRDVSLMFNNCTSLTSVPLLDTSNATEMYSMFTNCSSLKMVPLFNTSKVTNMNSMFQNCYNIESGALALYQQASSQATPPTSHRYTFFRCGRDTPTGAAELAQIPRDWK